MKNKLKLIIVVFILLLTGCQTNETTIVSSDDVLQAVADTKEKNIVSDDTTQDRLLVWIPFDYILFDDTSFLSENEGMTIEYKAVPKETVNSYLAGLLSDQGPDILVVNAVDYGVFSKLDVFENYNDPPYDFNETTIENDVFSQLGWSIFGDKKIGLMTHFSPLVTYYRSDILESIGYSSDPADVANYLSDTESLYELTRVLKDNNHYVVQWKDEYNKLMSSNSGFFDEDLAMNRNSSQSQAIYEFALHTYQENMDLNINFWSDEGTIALKKNELVMTYMGTWGQKELISRVPEQASKWKVTSLPFDIKAFDGYFMMIPSKSDNKEKAWEWVHQTYSDELYNWEFENNVNRRYLNNQDVSEYFQKGLEGSYNRTFTPFDGELDTIYGQRFNDYIQSEISFEQFIEAFENVISEDFDVELERYKRLR